MPSSIPPKDKPKYRIVLDALSAAIRSGQFQPGAKLPSESALVKKYNTSRITVGRALRELQHAGLVRRVAGSGSFVRNLEPAEPARSHLFGLLIPDLGETEIFDPICNGIANAPAVGEHALLWGHTDAKRSAKQEQSLELCRQYIGRKVSGVFFAPLEFERGAEKTNRAILGAFDNAHIPVVLLDHRPSPTSERRRHDLVGINNRLAGYVATDHLIRLGLKRIGFLGYHGSPSTISARSAGYEEALKDHGLAPMASISGWTIPEEAEMGNREFADDFAQREMEAWLCVNDRLAGQFMQSLLAAGLHIPKDVRIVGIDDVPYAELLSVPLTTVRQPCRLIGEAALATMLERIAHPERPARDLLLDGELVIRRSCGAQAQELRR